MNSTKLKAAIRQSSMTQKEIAAQSGISPQALNGIIEKGVDPRVSTLEAIAGVLGVKMSFLFDEERIEIKDNERSFNTNNDETIRELTSIIKSQEERIRQLTDKLLSL